MQFVARGKSGKFVDFLDWQSVANTMWSENFGEEQLTKNDKFGIRTNYSFVSYTLLSWEILKPRDVSFINGTGKLSIIVQNIEAT